MTTTGGPDQSFADPATTQSADDPVVISREVEHLDGDDITIEPDALPPHPRRRLFVRAVVAIVVIGAGIGIAIAANRNGSSNTGAKHLQSVSPVSPPAAHPKSGGAVGVKPNPPKLPVAPKITPKPPAVVAPPASVPTPPVVSPTAVNPPPPATTPTTPTPIAEPTSVLQWQSLPATLSMKGGAHLTFTVTVVNPTNGTVTLPTPLTCAPVLQGPKGATFGFGVCEQMAQVMSPHQRLTQRYTIYATDTADASGKALQPGRYTVSVENLHKFRVNITAA